MSSEQRAAMERIAITLYHGQGRAEPWEQLRDDIKDHWFRFADTALAAVEAAGWGPPVVTPEPDAEVRDVLAEALKVYYGIPADERAPEADGIADAGLAALRARGFAVVRTADVGAAMCDARSFRLQMKGWERADGTPVYEMDDDTEERLEEAIR